MKRSYEIRGLAPKRAKLKPSLKHYDCPDGSAFLFISDKRHKIKVLLDSGSNIFLLNQKTAASLKIPYQVRETPLQITAFNGEISSTGGKYYSHPIKLEIGTNGHTSMVSCAGKYDMIIPFGWWHQEHPIKNIETPPEWRFEHANPMNHVEDEGIADMFEWDETVAFDENATRIGRIGATKEKEVELDGLPKEYWQYKDLFTDKTGEMLAPRRTFDHAIDLKEGVIAPWGPIYPMSAYQLEELNKYLCKILAEGEIVHIKSPAGAPILFVPKPDGRLRLCVDYRQLNKETILNKYPLPPITELRERAAGATVITKLDLKDGYQLIRIRKADEWKTAFRTRYGHYEYKARPFGLVNAPATFQAMMNTILGEFLDQGVVVYLDDILIYSKSLEDHKALIKQVLAGLERYDRASSLKKSMVHVDTVEFLGYIIGKDGVTMSKKKVESILSWKPPRSVKDVQIFIGFANFYQRFIENFSKVCKLITDTLKTKADKKLWSWGPEQDKAFEELK